MTNKNVVIVALVGMFLCECVNGAVHLQFCRMRKADGSQERPIPMGPLFKFECLSQLLRRDLFMVFFTILTHSLPCKDLIAYVICSSSLHIDGIPSDVCVGSQEA